LLKSFATTNLAAVAVGPDDNSEAAAQKETVLHKFTGNADGAAPNAPLLRDDDGNLYGTATFGGNLNDCDVQGCGTVFKLSKTGELSTLYAFSGGDDGKYPNGPLVRDAEGNLYGTTSQGGTGGGVVFKVTSSGEETVLYTFGRQAEDGALPMAGLVRDSDGNLYGTTFAGGGNCPGYGCGTVYEVTPSGTERILWRFGHVANDGLNPFYTTLIRDEHGNMYGTTQYGGTNPGPEGTGLGTVFKVSAAGEEKVLYSFTGGTGGSFPYAGLVRDSNGNLYGTDAGYVFEITASGEEKTIYEFQISSGTVTAPLPTCCEMLMAICTARPFRAVLMVGGLCFGSPRPARKPCGTASTPTPAIRTHPAGNGQAEV
jgi:uncharacterized repeat protein (TIGR03803 family)